MSFVDDEMTVADIKDKIKSYRDEIPQLQDVKLSQNKRPLIEDAVAAVEDYYAQQQGLGEEEMEMETESADQDVDSGAGENEETASSNPVSRQSETLGRASNPLTP